MAFKRSFLMEDLNCSVCGSIFKDPMILTCSHSACKDCLAKFWEDRGARDCPICGKRSKNDPPLLNLILKNICEAVLEERTKRALLCTQHKRKIELYCHEDKQPICHLCREKHQSHNFSPINGIADGFRDNIIVKLHCQEENLKEIEDFRLLCIEMAEHIKVQAQHTETHIKEEFEKFHQYLREDEAERIAALKMEEEEKSSRMKEKIEEVSRDVALLKERISMTVEDLTTDDASLVLNYQSIIKRTGFKRFTTPLHPRDLIEVAKHAGNVMFNVWKEMDVAYFPVILDPNTAHPELNVSPDMSRSVRTASLQPVPLNPGRFLQDIAVLGYEGFEAGTHYWDVNVFDKRHWILGVITQSCLDQPDPFTHAGLWYVAKDYERYSAGATPQHETAVRLKDIPYVIRVRLDIERGKVAFSDPDNKKTFRIFKAQFSGKVFPYFSTLCGREPLKILLQTTSVSLQKPS